VDDTSLLHAPARGSNPRPHAQTDDSGASAPYAPVARTDNPPGIAARPAVIAHSGWIFGCVSQMLNRDHLTMSPAERPAAGRSPGAASEPVRRRKSQPLRPFAGGMRGSLAPAANARRGSSPALLRARDGPLS